MATPLPTNNRGCGGGRPGPVVGLNRVVAPASEEPATVPGRPPGALVVHQPRPRGQGRGQPSELIQQHGRARRRLAVIAARSAGTWLSLPRAAREHGQKLSARSRRRTIPRTNNVPTRRREIPVQSQALKSAEAGSNCDAGDPATRPAATGDGWPPPEASIAMS